MKSGHLSDISQKPKTHYLFIGNPGVGKSTLLNCIIGRKVFESGVSIGEGKTYELATKEIGNNVFMDTPGLEDTKKRKQAAKDITKALKQDGNYKIFFVVTLESGRVRPVDAALIKIVLRHAKEIKYFVIIFNKLSKNLCQKLQVEKNLLTLLVNICGGKTDLKPIPYLLERRSKLDDEENKIESIKKLNDFVHSIPSLTISKKKVSDIPGDDTFDRMKKENLKLRKELLENKNQMERKIEEMSETIEELRKLGFFAKVGKNAGEIADRIFEKVGKITGIRSLL